MTALGTACRLAIVAGAAAALAASASSNNNVPPPTGPASFASPEPRAMEPSRAVGLWKSSFGPVKIETDPDGGPEDVMGVWVYDRAGQEVVGYFSGALSGNVLEFRWQEPARPNDLTGEGYLVFDGSGRSFTGKWWTSSRDRTGEWNGWRAEGAGDPEGPGGPDGPGGPEGPDDGFPPDERGDRPPKEGPAEQAPGPPPETI